MVRVLGAFAVANGMRAKPKINVVDTQCHAFMHVQPCAGDHLSHQVTGAGHRRQDVQTLLCLQTLKLHRFQQTRKYKCFLHARFRCFDQLLLWSVAS